MLLYRLQNELRDCFIELTPNQNVMLANLKNAAYLERRIERYNVKKRKVQDQREVNVHNIKGFYELFQESITKFSESFKNEFCFLPNETKFVKDVEETLACSIKKIDSICRSILEDGHYDFIFDDTKNKLPAKRLCIMEENLEMMRD